MNKDQQKFVSLFDSLHKSLTRKQIKYRDNSFSFEPFVQKINRLEYLASERSFLKTCAQIRNIMQHNNDLHGAVTPERNVIERLNKINVQLTQKAVFKATREVFTVNNQDRLHDCILKMNNNLYTQVPVLNDKGYTIGILSENSIMNFIANNKNQKLPDFIGEEILHSPYGNNNERFRYKSSDSSFIDILTLFQKEERIGAVFLTDTGNHKSKIQGIITPWDLNFKGGVCDE